MNDATTTLSNLKTWVGDFCRARDWDQFHDPKELAIGLSTEAAELLEQFRFLSKEEVATRMATPDKRELIEDELADALFFVLRFADRNAIDLAAVLERKMEKNARKYPVELAKGRNLKYNEL